ncbi:MAG: hypothetical protein FWD11_08290 [Micrococcales bacterium]|nr:hypothetical protein [Micrococcales bacterium]
MSHAAGSLEPTTPPWELSEEALIETPPRGIAAFEPMILPEELPEDPPLDETPPHGIVEPEPEDPAWVDEGPAGEDDEQAWEDEEQAGEPEDQGPDEEPDEDEPARDTDEPARETDEPAWEAAEEPAPRRALNDPEKLKTSPLVIRKGLARAGTVMSLAGAVGFIVGFAFRDGSGLWLMAGAVVCVIIGVVLVARAERTTSISIGTRGITWHHRRKVAVSWDEITTVEIVHDGTRRTKGRPVCIRFARREYNTPNRPDLDFCKIRVRWINSGKISNPFLTHRFILFANPRLTRQQLDAIARADAALQQYAGEEYTGITSP